jgi:hypothetical protein
MLNIDDVTASLSLIAPAESHYLQAFGVLQSCDCRDGAREGIILKTDMSCSWFAA